MIQEFSKPIRNVVIRDNTFGCAHNRTSNNYAGVVTSAVKWNAGAPGASGQQLRPWRYADAAGNLGNPTTQVGQFLYSGNLYTDFNGSSADSYVCTTAVNCF